MKKRHITDKFISCISSLMRRELNQQPQTNLYTVTINYLYCKQSNLSHISIQCLCNCKYRNRYETFNFFIKVSPFYDNIPIDWLAVVNSPCTPFSSGVLWSSLRHADSTVLGSSTSLSI